MTPGGLPHSGIHGLMPADGSPWLIAAFHALHRLVAPRHPPCALNSSAPRIAPCRANRIELNRCHCSMHFLRFTLRPDHRRASIFEVCGLGSAAHSATHLNPEASAF